MHSEDARENSTDGRIADPMTVIPPEPKGADVSEIAGVWTISGRVEHGDRRGRLLGFPTANLHLEADSGVRDGVWAAEVAVADEIWVAAVSIGHRPTFYGRRGTRLLEAHLLDFDGDLYGKPLAVVLRAHLRPQRTFPNSVDLVRQMHADLALVREWSRQRQEAGRNLARGGRRREPSAPRNPERIIAARRTRQDRLIEAAAQDAESSGALDHEGVASRADVPLGFLQWAYPSVEDLQRASLRGALAHGRP